MIKWEYTQVHNFIIINHLNSLGAEGWELVSTVYNSAVGMTTAYLKRQIVEDERPGRLGSSR